jgi:drug/metabolite transporter (DMT)-like permease
VAVPAALVLSGLGVFHHHVGRRLVVIVLLSLASAASYGLAAVLQHQAAVREPPELSMRAGLLVKLARRPMWLVGNALDGVGYLFQFLALRRGSLTLVEPLLVLSLVFALPVAAWLDHRRVSASELASTATVAAGLALFLGVARPGLGHPQASDGAWAVLTILIAVACAGLTVGARRGSPTRAAVMLAAGSGIAFGYVAALTERTGHLLDGGIGHTLVMWEPYALVAGAVAALLLTQSAFHAGALRLSLPTLTVAQPLVAIAIGLGMFGERVDSRGIAPVVETLGLVLVVVGVFALGRAAPLGPEPPPAATGGDEGPVAPESPRPQP